jgi:predicted GH43/DUF377 family glycosyl hydrolase
MRFKHVFAIVAIIFISAGMAMGQTEWTIHPDNPVIDPGPPGSWDDHWRVPLAVHFDGSIYHLWFLGNNVALDHGDIGHATSPDGVDWTIDPANPVLTRGEPGEWDDAWILWGAGVIHDGTQFHLWYTAQGEQALGGGYATSPDGTLWTKHPDNPVLTPGLTGTWDDGGVDPHTVILEDGVFRMWYTGGKPGMIFQTGYAESTDGVHWTKHPNPVLEVGRYPGAWDSSVAENSFVVFDGTTYHMMYTGGHSNSISIGYAFSSDGIDWTKHGDSWVLTGSEGITTNSPVYFDGETFHMWYAQGFDSDGTIRIMYATSDCCEGVAGLTEMQTIPAAALASGAQGSFYQTDVDLNNAGGQPVQYEFLWFPRGEDNTDYTASETFTLGAGMSVRYENILSEVFGFEPNALGALAIMSTSPDLLCMTRTYNLELEKSGGTFGQAVPAVKPGDFITHGERRRILFGSQGPDYRTNIGCINGTDMLAAVEVELFNADGESLKTERLRLDPFSNDQLNAPFSDYAPVNGYVDVWTVMPNGLFYCYGSVLDNVTSDPTTILPK